MKQLLIIGATSDIALALANKYASSGYNLVLAARNVRALDSFAHSIRLTYKVNVEVYEFDVTAFDSHESFYKNISHKPDGVLVTVGYLGNQKKGEHDFDETLKIIETNYTGCVSILNIIANDMLKRKSGFIVGVSSVAGDRGRKENYLYGSAKSAFTQYLSGLRSRLAKEKITVLTVKPGFVKTKMTANLKLPSILTASTERVARDIYYAQQRGQTVVYTKWFWKYIMLVIKHIPESIFNKYVS